jgi:hypothetical protein
MVTILMNNTFYKIKIFQPEFDTYLHVFEGKVVKESATLNGKVDDDFFPVEFINKLDVDIINLCKEFNFAFINKKPLSGMLLLRRILPLSIVRKFQLINRESEICKDKEYLETKFLLGKVENLIKEKRNYSQILNNKPLIDSTQHSFVFSPKMAETERAANAIRLFLTDLFN